MTAIQVKYLEYLESKRKNLANEKLTAEQIKVERDKLAETIANNLRNYHVNVSKNEIQALYNDQLNDREVRKLAETVRSNLANENLKLKQALETERSNLSNEEIKRRQNEISNNQMLISAMTSGKSATIAGKMFDWFRGSVSAELVSGGDVSGNTVGTFSNYGSRIKDTAKLLENSNFISQIVPTAASLLSGPATLAVGLNVGVQALKNKRKQKEEDEIPTDFSSSRGPGYDLNVKIANPSNLIIAPKGKQLYSEPIGPQLPTNKITIGSTAGSPIATPTSAPASNNLNVSTPATKIQNASSSVIYAPGSKVGPGW